MGIIQIINFVKIAFSVLPLIKEGVAVLEKMFPERGLGASKLEILKAAISQALDAQNSGLVDNVLGFVEKTVSVMVGTFNQTGFPEPSQSVNTSGNVSIDPQINGGQ